MKLYKKLALAACSTMFVLSAGATVWTEGTITEIRVIATGTPANDGIVVLGTFTPSLGCTNSGLMLYSGDAYFKESYALLLVAKATGARIKFMDWYCLPSGYGRGNGYAIIP